MLFTSTPLTTLRARRAYIALFILKVSRAYLRVTTILSGGGYFRNAMPLIRLPMSFSIHRLLLTATQELSTRLSKVRVVTFGKLQLHAPLSLPPLPSTLHTAIASYPVCFHHLNVMDILNTAYFYMSINRTSKSSCKCFLEYQHMRTYVLLYT